MKFLIDDAVWIPRFDLVYRPGDYSFDAEPRPTGCISSVLIKYLELEVDDAGILQCATGLCSHLGWERTALRPPATKRKVVRVIPDSEWIPGIVKELEGAAAWSMFANYELGYVCIGDPKARGKAVEFAPGCVVVIDENKLVAVWLRPKELPPELSR